MSPAAIDPKAAALAVSALSALVLLALVALPRAGTVRTANPGARTSANWDGFRSDPAADAPGGGTVAGRVAFLRGEIARIDGLQWPVESDLATRATYAAELKRLGHRP